MSKNLSKQLISQITEQINQATTIGDVVRIARIVGGYRITERQGALVARQIARRAKWEIAHGATYSAEEKAWYRRPVGSL